MKSIISIILVLLFQKIYAQPEPKLIALKAQKEDVFQLIHQQIQKINIDQVPNIITVYFLKTDTNKTVFNPDWKDLPPDRDLKKFNNNTSNRYNDFEMSMSMRFDYINNDFGDFGTSLQPYNINIMDSMVVTYGLGLGFTFNRLNAGASFSFSKTEDTNQDELDIKFKTSRFGANIGYHIIHTKRFNITPKFSFLWNRYRLLNYDKKRKITLDEYIQNRDLDLRFNQLTGSTGLNFEFKVYESTIFACDFMSFGIYCDYIFNINQSPWLFSRGNRIETDGQINLNHLSLGLSIGWNYQ